MREGKEKEKYTVGLFARLAATVAYWITRMAIVVYERRYTAEERRS